MRIALGSDHAGYGLKEKLKSYLVGRGYSVDDCGTNSTDSCDYPDFAHAVATRVAGQRAERGILVCGTGIGMAISANKTAGVRAANITSEVEAQLSREHNDLNVLALGARLLGEEQAKKVVDVWLATAFAGGRHQRRVDKITELEKEATNPV